MHEKVNYAKKEEGEDGILLLAEKGEEASNENIWSWIPAQAIICAGTNTCSKS